MRFQISTLLLATCFAFTAHGQNTPAINPAQFDTRPTANNDTTLRALSPEEIPPNLNFYAVDPLYRADAPLGWAKERIEERIGRGLVARSLEAEKVYLSWRLLKSDPASIAFNVYRTTEGGTPTKLNSTPLATTTDFTDAAAPSDQRSTWSIRGVINGRESDDANTNGATTPPNAPGQNYHALKVKSDVTSISMVGIGDLDGDGVYDLVVKHPGGGKDPGRITVSRDTYKFDGYNGKTGEFMWRIDLGWNVDMGIWWTPMVVRDLDGDNKAEVCLRTKPYAATLAEALPGARAGNALEGPEWLSVYSGETGKLIDQVDWIELQSVQHWGDNTGNRASRHLMGVAYLDGKTPALLAVRGTYGVMKVDAWMLENRKLKKIWRWTNERAPFLFQGQGAHGLQVGDIDGDGFDEILNGAIAIDHDGRTMWSTGLGHGDRMYLTDIDPARPGLEVAYICEDAQPQLGVNLRDARNGDLLWGAREPHLDNAIDQVAVGDIDPKYPGMEVWINKGLKQLFYTPKGQPIPGPVPPTSELVWWDADLLREQLGGFGGGRGRGGDSTTASTNAPTSAPTAAAPTAQPGRGNFGNFTRTIGKWKDGALQPLTTGLQGAVHQVADILGDWREEVVTFSNGELRIYSTTIPATDRRVCLMQDPIYRHSVSFRTMGYTHVPQVSYYLGGEVSDVKETSISSVAGLPLVGTPPLAHKYNGSATNAGPTRYVRSARLVLLMLSAALALPLRAHDNYTSWVETVVHPDRLEVTLTLARTAALRLLPDANALPPITPESFPDYASRLKAVAHNLIEIRSADTVLTLSSREVTISGDADITYRLVYRRPRAGALRFTAQYLFQLVDGHVGTLVVSDASGKDLGWSPVTVDQPNFELKLPRDGTAK